MSQNYDLVPVMVPSPYVMEVYAYLAELASAATAADDVGSPLPGGTQGGEGEGTVAPWTEADLRRLASTNTISTKLVTRLLDVLAAEPGRRYGTSELVEVLQVNRNALRSALSKLTLHIRKHYARDNWPMKFE